MLKDFEALQNTISGRGEKTIAVAAAEDLHSLEALRNLQHHFPVRYFLVGDSAKMQSLCKQLDLDMKNAEIIDAQGEEESAAKAVSLAARSKADVLMKGKLQTSVLLKAVLNKETGIQQGGLMSHLAALQSPAYHKLLFLTDGGMNPHPDLSKKQAILENAVTFLQKLGYACPNAAALAAVETVSEKMPETIDAHALAEKNKSGEITGCYVEGPLSFDLAISRESARIKGADTKMAGEVDIFLAPDISAGNIMAKALLYLGGTKMAGCILGAKVPIVLTSRGATAEEKFLSFLLTMAAG